MGPEAEWHSLPELNRAFAVGETAFLTARRRERYSRNKTSLLFTSRWNWHSTFPERVNDFTVYFLFLIKHGVPAGIFRCLKTQKRLFRGILFQSHGRKLIPAEPAAFRGFQIGAEGTSLLFA